MDKYEYKIKLAQIEKLAAKKDYVTAARIADGIDWRKVKSVTTLNLVADIYEANNRLEDCYEILNMVYDRSPVGRRVVYHMTEIATKMHDFEEAIDLYREFVKIAPHDLGRYILKYQIYRERGSSVADQIIILEEYKSHEYDEKWSYELACLYEEAGMLDRCIEECDELILWFSEGEYVAKAMELKMKYQELTASQQEKFEHRYEYLNEEKDDVDETETAEESVNTERTEELEKTPVSVSDEPEDDTPKVSEINTNKFSTINLQEELAKGLQMILAQVEEEAKEEAAVQAENELKEEAAVQTEAETEEVITQAEPETKEETVQAETETKEESAAGEENEISAEAKTTEEKPLSETAEIKSELLKYAVTPPQPKPEELFCTEEDGQISLALGNEDVLEKQITGQMTIEEILEAWEEKKRQAREQMAKLGDKKEAVLYETGEITGLLEDFVPRTPREVQEIIEEIEEEQTLAEQILEEQTFAEQMTEELMSEESAPEELEDDLPVDIDLAEALEAALKEPKEEKEVPEELKKEPVGQNTASMLDAIERALAQEIAPLETAGKYLTEEQEKIFAYFTSVAGMKKQLVELLGEDSLYDGREDSKEGNLIITGHPGNGKTTLAIDIVKAFQKQRKSKGGKLAKVTGDGMNKKTPKEVVNKLGGGALIIERAGSLSDETVKNLSDAMEGMTGGLLVILEDDQAEIESLLERNPGFAVKFNRSIDIPIFSNDELVAFGKSYAEEQEFYFEEMAVLALYDCIGVRQTSDHVVNIAEVKEVIDDAITHAEKKSRGLLARLSKKRIDEDGNKLLLEEDFDY